jgi:HAD superfamily hydrolase (TIGR01509 family)
MQTAAILDIDGTLVDSNDAHARAWVDAFAEAGLQVPFDAVRRAIGMGGDKLLPQVAGISADSPQASRISKRRAEIFAQRYLSTLQPFPRVRELLQRLTDDGFTIVVATSANGDEVGALLDAAGVRDLISSKTSSDDAERSKPDPDIVAAALARSGADPYATLMLGDTPYDVEAARSAGIAIVAVEGGGWTRDDLRGAIEVYADAADLYARYEQSAFARLRDEARAAADARGRVSSRWGLAAPFLILSALAVIGALAYARHEHAAAARQREPHDRDAGELAWRRRRALTARERNRLRQIIARTS